MAKSQPPRNTPPSPVPPPPARDDPPDNRPAASFKYGVAGGVIEVAVWPKRMTGDGGREFTVYNVTFGRSYKDGETWKTSDNVRGSDIPILLHALQQAYGIVLDDRANGNGH